MIGEANALLSEVPELKRSLDRRTAKALICDKLTALIASGVLKAGDSLPGERDLAAALLVSRETVRGAVQMLAGQGILTVAHGSRTRVAAVDIERLAIGIALPHAIDRYDLESVHRARLLIELKVVGDAAELIDDAALASLDALLAVQADMQDDPVRFLISDREFHVTIYRACGNPLLADLVTDLYTYMMEHRRRALMRESAIQHSFQDHVAAVDALRRHDRAGAIAAFTLHLDRIYRTTQSILTPAGQPDIQRPQRGTRRADG